MLAGQGADVGAQGIARLADEGFVEAVHEQAGAALGEGGGEVGGVEVVFGEHGAAVVGGEGEPRLLVARGQPAAHLGEQGDGRGRGAVRLAAAAAEMILRPAQDDEAQQGAFPRAGVAEQDVERGVRTLQHGERRLAGDDRAEVGGGLFAEHLGARGVVVGPAGGALLVRGVALFDGALEVLRPRLAQGGDLGLDEDLAEGDLAVRLGALERQQQFDFAESADGKDGVTVKLGAPREGGRPRAAQRGEDALLGGADRLL